MHYLCCCEEMTVMVHKYDTHAGLQGLEAEFRGEIHTDLLTRTAYATDASAYMEMPEAVVYPEDEADVRALIRYAARHGKSVIPRCAGTSIAGQVVGAGIVADVSRRMNGILEINATERWVRVQPGVVLDELNIALRPYGLFFAPEASTSNRCCIGGMAGNNACGAHSLRYGSTRDHIIAMRTVLADGSVAVFSGIDEKAARRKTAEPTLEGRIYKGIIALLSSPHVRDTLRREAPDISLRRRNNGYALDLLTYCGLFDPCSAERLNLCKLLAGSEGTLAFATELTLHLEPLPPAEQGVVCVHCRSLDEAFRANLIALRHNPTAVELMDNNIISLSRRNITQRANSAFVVGDPAAILIVEFAEATPEALAAKADALQREMESSGYGYAFPLLRGEESRRVWNLRKAGLGLLSNMPGDAKPVSVIEDTAVPPERLPDYMNEFRAMLSSMGLSCVYHAHIGTGELHTRPVINMKSNGGRRLFRRVATETARLVKKYRGSLSGEHGDGRLRGEFIPMMFGEEVYGWFRDIKRLFDPRGTLNPGKITDTPPMDSALRYVQSALPRGTETYFDFSGQGWIQAVEQCSGAADCRKSRLFSGAMCPAYRATGDELFSTRARANIMRAVLHGSDPGIFNDRGLLRLLSECLSCKACASECPSGVDMARLKAEYLQHHYNYHGTPLAARLTASLPGLLSVAAKTPHLYNFMASNALTSTLIKLAAGIASERTLPRMAGITLRRWFAAQPPRTSVRKVHLFVDEFTDHTDVAAGQDFIRLLWAFGYEVILPPHVESGRTAISAGMLKKARETARRNIALLSGRITPDAPLVGLEPGALLTLRDEYPALAGSEWRGRAESLASNTLLYDEFIMREAHAGRIAPEQFTDRECHILLHGHCHQRSLASVRPSQEMLSLPVNYHCTMMDTSCCGMAGAFGYQKSHYRLSMEIGRPLFDRINAADSRTLIAATGTSCRQQIKDGTGRTALHPVQILYEALDPKLSLELIPFQRRRIDLQ